MNAVVVKERPILFSGPMVRAILDGSKTQTRRIVKTQPIKQHHIARMHDGWTDEFRVLTNHGSIVDTLRCPYGKVGDRLWVRETWCRSRNNTFYRADNGDGRFKPNELSEEWDWDRGEGEKWRPSIFMPRSLSRITLEVTCVRVERLNEITPSDACAEGVFEDGNYATEPPLPYPVATFKKLWQSINGPDSWTANPWVWVIQFKTTQPV